MGQLISHSSGGVTTHKSNDKSNDKGLFGLSENERQIDFQLQWVLLGTTKILPKKLLVFIAVIDFD